MCSVTPSQSLPGTWELKQRRTATPTKTSLENITPRYFNYVANIPARSNCTMTVAEQPRNKISRNGVQIKKENENITVLCSSSLQNLEFGHFTLLFCRGRQKHIPIFQTQVRRDCFSYLNPLFCGVLVAVAVVVAYVPKNALEWNNLVLSFGMLQKQRKLNDSLLWSHLKLFKLNSIFLIGSLNNLYFRPV